MNNSNPSITTSSIHHQVEKSFDFREFFFRFILRYWLLYVLCLTIALGGAWLYLRYTIPRYESRSTILIKDEGKSGSGGAISEETIFQGLGLGNGNKNIENEIQILKSRTLMLDVVRELGLEYTLLTEGRVITSEWYENAAFTVDSIMDKDGLAGTIFTIEEKSPTTFKLSGDGTGNSYAYGEKVALPKGSFILLRNSDIAIPGDSKIFLQFNDPAAVAASYAAAINIRPVKDYASVLQMSLEDPQKKKARDILDKLVDVYNRAALEDKNKVSTNTLQFIEDRLVYLTQELKEVETNIVQYKTSKQIPLDVVETASRFVGELMENDKELAQLNIQINVLASIEDYLKSNNKSYELIPSNLQVASPAVSELLTNFNLILLERDRLLKTATSENPMVQSLNDKLSNLKAAILQSIQNNQRSLEMARKLAESKSKIANSRLSNAPRMQQELVEIARQQHIKESLYLFLLQKREETALTMAVTTPNSRVIDAAVTNGGAVFPKRKSIHSMAIFLGLAIPALIVFLLDMMNDSVRSQKDIESATRAPLIAGIAYNNKKENIVVKKGSRSAIAEMFRLLRANLQFVGAGEENKVILVTSSTSGEGKSFITLNLGASLALSDKKTILISLDLRKPKLSKYMGKEDTDLIGISNYLVGNAQITDIILPTDAAPNLFYIPSGPIPPNPSELILGPAMNTLFDYLRKHFDYIVIDTPPVGLVADALLLNQFIDSSLYVVLYSKTKKGQLGILEDIYQNQKLKKPGIVFNGLKAQRGYGYGGYEYGYTYGYSYGGGYGYGYYDDD